MKYFVSLICILCLLVAGGPVWSAPNGKYLKYLKQSAGRFPAGYFRNQIFRNPLANTAPMRNALGWEKTPASLTVLEQLKKQTGNNLDYDPHLTPTENMPITVSWEELQRMKQTTPSFPPGYFHNKTDRDALAELAAYDDIRGWEKKRTDTNAAYAQLKQQPVEFNTNYEAFLDDYDENEGAPSMDVPSVKMDIVKPKMPDFHPVPLREIEDRPEILDIYDFAPEDATQKDPEEARRIIGDVNGTLISNMFFRNDLLKDVSKMMVFAPFETRPMDEIFMESAALFYARADDELPVDFQFLPAKEKLRKKLDLQKDFYFDILPYSFLVLTSQRIEPNYLEEAVRYYFLTLSVADIPLHRKIRSLTMLSFLCQPYDRINGIPITDIIIYSLYHDFGNNPPWIVDYAAGMALLNLHAPQKIQDVVQWRRQVDARRGRRTPGIAMLYREIFGKYDFYVQDLGAFPYMQPDSKEDREIALNQLHYIRSKFDADSFEEMMWRLSDVNDMVVFLNLKGSVAQPIPTSQETQTEPEDPSAEPENKPNDPETQKDDEDKPKFSLN